MMVLASGLAAQPPQNPIDNKSQEIAAPAARPERAANAGRQPDPPTNTENASPSPSGATVIPASPPVTPDQEGARDGNGAQPGDSHVRIVRLSQAQGKLGLDRGTGKIEPTMQNMPIVEGSRLATSDGYAEVEFEDGSTLRVAPESEVDFPQLLLRSNGVKATTVRLIKGTMYVNLEKTKENDFTVKSGDAVLKVEPATHLRVELADKKSTLAVFKGNVAVESGAASATVEKKRTAVIDGDGAAAIDVAKNLEEAPYDAWDNNAIDYHSHYAGGGNAFGSSLYSYGIPDLNYYGGFVGGGGCGGSFWRPYFADAAWDPYGNGVWAWYQGAGYSWVSPYPWGWLPYHSGAWSFCPGVGWGWRPGGAWRGLGNGSPAFYRRPGIQASPAGPRGGSPLRPPGPVRPGTVPKSTLLISNRTPLVTSKMNGAENFVFQKNSAGLGVPRGELGNLRGISNNVVRNGFVNRQVFAEPMAGGREAIRPGAPLTLRSNASPGWLHESHAEPNRGAAFNQRGGNGPAGASAGSFHGGAQNGSGGSYRGGGNSSGYHGGGEGGGFHGGGGGSTGGGGGGFHGGGGGGASSSGGGGGHK